MNDMALVDLLCDNKSCEKYKHWIFAAMIKRGEVVKVTCPFCDHKYEVKE